MASAAKSVHVLLILLLLCLVHAHAASDCNYGHGCFYVKAAASQEFQNRKVLYGMHGKEVGGPRSANVHGGSLVDSEMRRVPSGPDPLHHNGANPKKPTTP